MTKEYEYIALTREQTETLWKDVTLYWKPFGTHYQESKDQKEWPVPISKETYYLQVEKLDA